MMPEQEQDELKTTQVETAEGETTEPSGEASGEGGGDTREAGDESQGLSTDFDPIAEAQHACETRQPTTEELRLARCAEILKGDQKLPTVRQLAMEALHRLRCCKGKADPELDDALVAVSTKTGVTSVMQRLAESAAVYGHRKGLKFGQFTATHLGDIAQGIDREWLDEHGVPLDLQALVVDLLRCQLAESGE